MLIGGLVDYYYAQFENLPCSLSKTHLFLESEIIYVHTTGRHLREYAYLVCSRANANQDALSSSDA